MDKYSESELLPTHQKFHRSQIDGKRTVVEIAFTPKLTQRARQRPQYQNLDQIC